MVNNNPLNPKALQLETKTCNECGEKFEARVIKAFGVNLPSSSLCPKCVKKYEAEREKKEKEEKENELKYLRVSWRLHSGIPLRFMKERFETFKVSPSNKRVYEVCLKYANEFSIKNDYPTLGLFSKLAWGVGKTHLISAIGHKIIDNWEASWRALSPVYYITESQLFIKIRGSFNRPSDSNNYETEQDIYKRLSNVPLLIIDDVGKEEVADARFVQRVWFNIVNERYDSLKPIVIATNLNPDEIAHHLGGSRNNEATFDRLYEMLGGVFYEMTGKSYRRRETK